MLSWLIAIYAAKNINGRDASIAIYVTLFVLGCLPIWGITHSPNDHINIFQLYFRLFSN